MRSTVDPRPEANDEAIEQNKDAQLRSDNARLQREISELKIRLAKAEAAADSDTLTPLPNRRRYIKELQRVISYVARYQSGAALLYVDVDDLKRINDTHGHQAGDAALIHVADMLREALRATDLVARIGGDEFGLLIEPIDEADVIAKIGALRAAICAKPLTVDGVHVTGAVSMGYTMVRGDDTVESALARGCGDVRAQAGSALCEVVAIARF